MILSDLSVKRPILAGVVSALLVTIGILSFQNLPLRELPDVDVPVVSITTTYRGASADVIESRVTQVIEEQIRGIEGVKTISSSSRAGVSSISIEFSLARDLDNAANDVRDSVSRVVRRLPEEVDPPRVAKSNADERPIVWYNLNSTRMGTLELADYAERYLVDRLAVIDGVARIRVGGGKRYAMRLWLDRVAMAARQVTVADVERALRSENVELPAGSIESQDRAFPIRVARNYRSPEDFASLVIGRGQDGHLIRIGEIADVEIGAEEDRVFFEGNGEAQVGLGVVKQSTANTLSVARGTRAEIIRMREALPEGMSLNFSYDGSVFIEHAIKEVYRTLSIAVILVIIVIYLFLGTIRAAIIPAITVPICLISTASILFAFGLSINLLTLLALILSIGLVVDDTIVVLENVQRRIDLGEPPLLAAYRGARQVGFAVIATTLVLLAVFLPIVFMEGFVGKLFSELALTLSGAVAISSLVALSLSPMMCSKLLRSEKQVGPVGRSVNAFFERISVSYVSTLRTFIARPRIAGLIIAVILTGAGVLIRLLPQELAPNEDRGGFFVFIKAAEGTNYEAMVEQVKKVQDVLHQLLDRKEAKRVLVRVPGSFSTTEDFSSGLAIVSLVEWADRERTGAEILADMNRQMSEIPGVMSFAIMSQGFTRGGSSSPLQFVIGGTDYEALAEWRDAIMQKVNENPRILRPQSDYRETRPEFQINIDTNRAADLGVSVDVIGQTLEAMLGARRVTTYVNEGEEYNVMVQARREDRSEPNDLDNIFVRSNRTGALIPLSNLVTLEERADAGERNHFNRLRAITISASLAPGYPLGDAIDFVESAAREVLPRTAVIDYKGQSADYKESGSSLLFLFSMALVIVFLVLAAQFESLIHPFVIMVTVPLAVGGGLFGLYMVGSSMNVYSTIGMVILIGLSAKNGILIVEFANQLRDEGKEFSEALEQAAKTRLRPILMTGLSTAIGAAPLVFATGAGAGSRLTIGVVVLSGVLFATCLTIFIVPVFYNLLARNTKSPGTIAKMLNSYEQERNIGAGAVEQPAE